MKKLIAMLVLLLGALAVPAQAGEMKVWEIPSNSGATVYHSDSGVSLVAVFDLKGMDLTGTWSVAFPEKVYFARNPESAVSPYGAETTTISGNTITYRYGVSNKQLSEREWTALGTSGTTQIVSVPVGSGQTVFQVWAFTPEQGRYVALLCQTGVTTVNKPGAVVTAK